MQKIVMATVEFLLETQALNKSLRSSTDTKSKRVIGLKITLVQFTCFALKQRLEATRKWPINLVHLHSELVVIKALVVIHGFSVNYVFFFSTF